MGFHVPAARRTPFTKVQTQKHWQAMLDSKRPMKTWCRSNKILMGVLIRSVIKHFPEVWEEYKDKVGEVFLYTCRGCKLPYYANSKKQALCSDSCGQYVWDSHMKKDRQKVSSADGTQNPTG